VNGYTGIADDLCRLEPLAALLGPPLGGDPMALHFMSDELDGHPEWDRHLAPHHPDDPPVEPNRVRFPVGQPYELDHDHLPLSTTDETRRAYSMK
jgi:hypothetical protein